MDVRNEIAKRVERLPADVQEQVLRHVTSLSSLGLVGEHGVALREYSHSIDPTSAQQMSAAIEEECERVDTSEW